MNSELVRAEEGVIADEIRRLIAHACAQDDENASPGSYGTAQYASSNAIIRPSLTVVAMTDTSGFCDREMLIVITLFHGRLRC